jgi:hypothetical protein
VYKNRSGEESGDPRIIPPLRNQPYVLASVDCTPMNVVCALIIVDCKPTNVDCTLYTDKC